MRQAVNSIYAECDLKHNVASVKTASFMRQASGCNALGQALVGESGGVRRSGQPYFSQAATNPIRPAKAMNSGCRRTRRTGSISAQSDISQHTIMVARPVPEWIAGRPSTQRHPTQCVEQFDPFGLLRRPRDLKRFSWRSVRVGLDHKVCCVRLQPYTLHASAASNQRRQR